AVVELAKGVDLVVGDDGFALSIGRRVRLVAALFEQMVEPLAFFPADGVADAVADEDLAAASRTGILHRPGELRRHRQFPVSRRGVVIIAKLRRPPRRSQNIQGDGYCRPTWRDDRSRTRKYVFAASSPLMSVVPRSSNSNASCAS